ncbi:MAG: T9SS type A sorting domain-containing protein [candidate division WOR-3 bacterium]|nr:T9SS type A sorting domain-containing protein [candidate division WOR-3 bacterium]
MKKTRLLVAVLIALPLALFAAERVVVLEIATGTWCPNCPAAARGADGLAEEHPGKVLVVEYHGGNPSDPFITSETQQRINYYGITGYPTAVFDGLEIVVGGSYGGNMFFTYNAKYNIRANIEPPLEISLTQTTNALASTSGSLRATITNVSNETVSGHARFTITESHISYTWQGMDNLDFVARDLLPDPTGEFISLEPGEDVVLTRSFTIDETWPYFTEDDNIEFGCFVQDVSKEILQAAVLEFGEPTCVQEDRDLAFFLNIPAVVGRKGSVELSLDAASEVSLTLFDATGRLVKTLYSGSLSAGSHLIDIRTDGLPAGAYFLRATAGAYNRTGKLVILD